MPINESKKLAFIHIPKTAGTTIEYALDMTNSESFYSTQKLPGFAVCPQHLTAKQLDTLVDLSEYFVFTIVRNPMERFISEYRYLQKINPRTTNMKRYNIDELARFMIEMDDLERTFIFDGHMNTQKSFIKDMEHFVTVFHFEKLQKCFDYLQEFYGPITFSHKMISERIPINISTETKNLIQEFYKEDYEYFGYELNK